MNVGLLLSAAGAGMLLALVAGRLAPRAWLAATVAATVAGFAAAASVLLGGLPWEWRGAFRIGGEPLHLRLDAVSAVFLALLCVVGGLCSVYSSRYWSDREHPVSAPTGRMWWSVLLASIGMVLLSSNGLHFLVFWEIFTVASYFLVTLERRKAEVRAAGWLYLAASHTATLCLFAYFTLLASRTGTWDLGPLRDQPGLAPLFWLALVGFGVKAGLFPLHIWLPSAHASAPSHVSAIMSGVTIKMGIYGLVRFTGWLPVPAQAGWVLAALGVASAVLGVAFAIGQHDLKRLLAYHSVENIGIILLGFGFALIAARHGHPVWGQVAMAGSLLHVWNHGLFKSLLFLGAGSVLHATGTREMSQLGGLWKRMPWTAALFGLGAAAISGLPPLNGFVSEWLVYLGLFDAVNARGFTGLAAVPSAVALAITGALALACFIKVCGTVFLGAARGTAAARAHESGRAMRLPMVALGLACVAIGLAPLAFWPAIARAVSAWDPTWAGASAPESLAVLGRVQGVFAAALLAASCLLWLRVRRTGLRKALTWDCGYAAPTARMQYTPGSFGATITEWFAWILVPERHEHRPEGLFPGRSSFEEHTPDTVLERVFAPVADAAIRVATQARRLQHGKVQAYLFYIVVGLMLLAAVAASGSKP